MSLRISTPVVSDFMLLMAHFMPSSRKAAVPLSQAEHELILSRAAPRLPGLPGGAGPKAHCMVLLPFLGLLHA